MYMNYKRILIVGAGFAGLNAALALKNARATITIIDKTNHHLFQPLLYQVAGATLSPRDIATSVREIVSKYKNISVVMGEVIEIDKEANSILLGDGEKLEYDYLLLAPGARHSYFGNEHWEEYAPGLKTLSDALKIREHILMSFERAERLDSIAETHKYLTFAIVGGGPTGVEMAGTIAEIISKTMKKNFRRIRTEKARVLLIEGFDRILPPFDPKLSARAKRDLEKLGVQVLTSSKVTEINNEGLQVDNQFIECKNIIWAAGNAASPLLKTIGSELDRQGRAIVEKDLSIPGHPNIFVLGDGAHVAGKKGVPLPAIAPVAIQQGKYLGKLLKKEVVLRRTHKRRKSFKYLDKGAMATIGSYKAVGYSGKFKFTGIFAWFSWGVIHVAYLIGYRNKMSVILEWMFHHLTGARAARIIYSPIEDKLTKKGKTESSN